METIKNKWIEKTRAKKEPEAKKKTEPKDSSPYSFAARANYKVSLRGIRK